MGDDLRPLSWFRKALGFPFGSFVVVSSLQQRQMDGQNSGLMELFPLGGRISGGRGERSFA